MTEFIIKNSKLLAAWAPPRSESIDQVFPRCICVGNRIAAELFEQNIGENTPVGLARGLNAQWTDGGLLYAPPFR